MSARLFWTLHFRVPALAYVFRVRGGGLIDRQVGGSGVRNGWGSSRKRATVTYRSWKGGGLTGLPRGVQVAVRVGDRPGDLGAVTSMHGVFYAREYGMNRLVEAHIAAALGDFVIGAAPDGAAASRLWVAEHQGRLVGSIGITAAGGGAAQLRWFLVAPEYRGHGLGRRLRDVALDHARSCGFGSVFLWTFACLESAHQLYRQAGFALVESRPTGEWGVPAIEQRFTLELNTGAAGSATAAGEAGQDATK